MSDIKKTALVILIIALLSNTFTQYAYAANDIDHDELMQYEGYGQAMYESIVEQTTFLTGQYTDNREYVRESINEIKNYADSWYNEYNDFTSSCYQTNFMSCLGEMTERGGAYVLTVGDWIKNLFDSYTPEEEEEFFDHDFYNQVFTENSNGRLTVNEGWSVQFSRNGDFRGYATEGRDVYAYWTASSGGFYSFNYGSSQDYVWSSNLNMNLSGIGAMLSFLNHFGYSMQFSKDGQSYEPNGSSPSPRMDNIRNYINNNPVEVPLPKLEPSLICPDGTRIKMGISGSTFISVNGETMLVNKDGTAEVNGTICNLNWQKPTVDYTPDGDVKITQPDGTEGDGMPNFTDLEGCDGAIMCGIAKMLDGLGSVVKAIGSIVNAITGLVGKILDGLLGLFVPDDLDFMTEEFNKITKKLNDKIAITDSLKDAIKGLFDGGGSNPLSNISINLPITNEPLTFGNVSFIEEGVPILRRVISAIVVLYTIAYVYRKITGRGGVMER